MSTVSLPRRRPDQAALRPLVPVALGVVGAAIVGVICSRVAISHYGVTAIEAIVFLPLLVAVARRPLVAVMALLAVVSSIFSYGTLPGATLPGFHQGVNVADMLLAAAVLGTIWRRPWRSWPLAARRYVWAMLIFLALAGVATVKTAMLGHVPARNALDNFRYFLFLGLALTIALELRGRLWRPFLDAAIALAAIIAVLSIGAAISGSIAHLLATFTPWSVVKGSSSSATAAGTTGAARIRVEGLFLVYAMCIPTLVLALVVKDRWRWLRALALLLMIGAIGVSLNRNMYGGALVGLAITALLGGGMLRARLGLIAVGAAVAVFLIATTSVAPAISSSVGKRASTLLSPSHVLKSGSLTDRTYELSFALPAIGRHPWFGVGPQQPYGAVISEWDPTPRTYVQNFYINTATDYGIPTVLAFLLVPGVCLLFGLRRFSSARSTEDRALLAAGIGTVVALLLSLLVGTYLQGPESTAAFAAAEGLLLAAALRTYDSPAAGARQMRTAR